MASRQWNKSWYCFGVVAPGEKLYFDFEYLGDIPIKEGVNIEAIGTVQVNVTDGVRGSCGCTSLTRDGNKLKGTLQIDKDWSGSEERFIRVHKSVTVWYTDNSYTNLYLEAVIDKTLDVKNT